MKIRSIRGVGRSVRSASVMLTLCLGMIFSLLTVPACSLGDSPKSITIFAAASTTNVTSEIARLFNDKGPWHAVCSFAASSTLAKQIANGAPADVYISADRKWMDYLADKGRIDTGTRIDLLGNRIVLIAPSDSTVNAVSLSPECDLKTILGDSRLAMGDPDHVPAGRYGKAALATLGVWASLERSVARAQTVRAALAMVERRETPLGVVYATDAAISKKVKIVARFPEESHPAIVYPAAIVAGRTSPPAERFLVFLQGPEARAVFERAGFTVR